MKHVTRSGTFDADADAVWAAIGDFHALGDWHPAVVKQMAEGDLRHLEVPGGAVIVERLIGQDTRSYAYEIVSGPLPVSAYRSVISAAPAGKGSVVVWSSTFEPTAGNAADVIAGIYEAGLAALAERFGGAGLASAVAGD